MKRRRAMSCGDLVAISLAGAWRNAPPKLQLDAEELRQITQLLLDSSAGALGWWNMRDSDLRDTPAANELRDAYRHYTLLGHLSEFQLMRIIKSFHAWGVEAVLVKGRAIAEVYPEPGLRPYCDFDFCVRDEHLKTAVKALEEFAGKGINIELRPGFGGVMSEQFDPKNSRCETGEIFARSQLIDIAGSRVRVPSAEDHLRIICLHFLKHSCQRPLWLCDVAALLESHSSDFNWDLALDTNRKLAWATICVCKLAQQLLGADEIKHLPIEYRRKKLPRWLKPAVLKRWETPSILLRSDHQLMSGHLLHPMKWRAALLARWADPIWTTYRYGVPFNNFPRLPFQIGDGMLRTARFIKGRSRRTV